MKEAVLIGTSHPIQRGNSRNNSFQTHLTELCKIYEVKAIAEEIEYDCVSVANSISNNIGIKYKIIEPTPAESIILGIEKPSEIAHGLMSKYDFSSWPEKPSQHNMPIDAYKEYDARLQTTYRQREDEWLKRIQELDTWPVLIICGSDHFEPFYDLLSDNGICVQKESSNWSL